MNILYRQKDGDSPFARCGVTSCYLKRITPTRDGYYITKKHHRHVGFELHAIISGGQIYEVLGREYAISCGELLLIPPSAVHRVLASQEGTVKLSFTFTLDAPSFTAPICAKIPQDVLSSMIGLRERGRGGVFAETVFENRVFLLLAELLMLTGYREEPQSPDVTEGDGRLGIAKQYVKDNIDRAITVSELSACLHLGEKQVTRLFMAKEGVTPAVYIRKRRAERAERLLTDTSLSLREISELMSFSSEYHFNSFFKATVGISPGEYRRMHKSRW